MAFNIKKTLLHLVFFKEMKMTDCFKPNRTLHLISCKEINDGYDYIYLIDLILLGLKGTEG